MTKTKAIDNTQDVIDSRDVIERIEALVDSKDEAEEAGTPFDDDEAAELAALQKLQEEAEGYCPDWKYGAGLVRDSYFKAYAQELADDIGAINRDATWPTCHIDWDAACDALKQDYTSVEFDGVTYWVG